jgi:hypothetical protein
MDDQAFHDAIDQTNIDQLHKAVLQLSNNCFELKKFCVTVLISAITLITTFTNKQLDPFIFFAGFFVVMFFWILDSQSYYYQEKLRARMKELASDIAKRHSPRIVIDGVGMPLDKKREERNISERVLASLFNWSMVFYLFLAILVIVIGLLYSYGYLISYPASNQP